MKIRVYVLALFALGSIGANLRCIAESPEELRDKLVEMGAADQAVRDKLVPLLASGNFESADFKAVAQEMASVDAQNLAELREIIGRHCWPDVNVVGSDAANSAFLIVQHSAHGRLWVCRRSASISSMGKRNLG